MDGKEEGKEKKNGRILDFLGFDGGDDEGGAMKWCGYVLYIDVLSRVSYVQHDNSGLLLSVLGIQSSWIVASSNLHRLLQYVL